MAVHRRDVLRAAALATVGGLSALAGCSAAGASTPVGVEPTLLTEPAYGDWFDGVSNYAGTVDRRDESTVTVDVGARGNLGAFGFGPAAVAVSPGTTVVWRWTGRGGGHNVVADDGTYDSGPLVDEAGHSYERRFDAPGVSRYVCEPHRAMGMRGAVAVLADDAGS